MDPDSQVFRCVLPTTQAWEILTRWPRDPSPASKVLPQHCECTMVGSPLLAGHTLVSAFGEDGYLSEIFKIFFANCAFL